MEEVKFRLEGLGAQLMKNGQMADRFNPFTKKVAEYAKRASKLTEDEVLEKYRYEWEGSLYRNPKTGAVGWPAENVLRCLQGGAKRLKLGRNIERGVVESEGFFDLTYDGPKDVDGLWEDGRFVDVRNVNANPSAAKKSTVQRCRPIFPEWSLGVAFIVDTREISVEDLEQCMELAGLYIGLSDYRPRFGRFRSEKL